VTLNLVLGATDGFLAVTDGLRTKSSAGAGPSVTQAIDDRKLLVVPDASCVLLTSGRATYNRIHVSEVLAKALSHPSAASGDFAGDFEGVARLCARTLARESDAVTSYDAAGLVLVGYDSAGALRAFQVDDPPTDYGDGKKSIRPVVIDQAMPVIARPLSDASSLVHVEFDSFTDGYYEDDDSEPLPDAGYRFAGLTLAEVRPLALARLRTWLTTNDIIAAEYGIGGLWSIAEVAPAVAPRVKHGVDLMA
jgi:hypothetical protein